jgi:hypothetical protein
VGLAAPGYWTVACFRGAPHNPGFGVVTIGVIVVLVVAVVVFVVIWRWPPPESPPPHATKDGPTKDTMFDYWPSG